MKDFSSLENKAFDNENLETVVGGVRRASLVYSNFLYSDGSRDVDLYDRDGNFVQRYADTTDCE